jgi:hypothetical protein
VVDLSRRLSQPKATLRNQVPARYLTRMAYMGLDESFKALSERQTSKHNTERYQRAIKWRTRFSENKLNHFGKNSTQIIPEEILDLPFRLFVYPMGSGGYLKLGKTLPRTPTAKNVFDYLNSDDPPPTWAKEVSGFKAKALASLSFHAQAYRRAKIYGTEEDVLDYVFSSNLSSRTVKHVLLDILDQNQKTFVDTHSDIAVPIFKRLTVDALQNMKNWRKVSFEQICQDVASLPRLAGLTNQSVSIWSPFYPEQLRRMSIFCVCSSSDRNNVMLKVETLHRMGLCSIGDTALLTEPFRSIFSAPPFDTRFQESLSRAQANESLIEGAEGLNIARSSQDVQQPGTATASPDKEPKTSRWQIQRSLRKLWS